MKNHINSQTLIKQHYRLKQFLLVSLIVLGFAFTASEAKDIQVSLTENQCKVSLSTPSGDNCDAGQCSGQAGCVCATKGDFVSWTLPGGDKYKMKFSGASPLHTNCGKNFKSGNHKCKIKEEVSKGQQYDYVVILQKCANGTDPRIVIR